MSLKLRLFSTFVKNIKNPIYVNCIHYIEHKYYNPYELNKKLGHCAKFGTRNLVTGNIEYDDAILCRIYDDKCGISGKLFIPKNNDT